MIVLPLFILILFLTAALLLFGVFNLATILRAAPFVTTPRETVQTMIKLAKIRPGEKACDIGSGEGRIVIALARAGAEAHGFEINPLLVLWSKWNVFKSRLTGKALMHWKSFWKQDFQTFQVVTMYGITHMMKNIEGKLLNELQPGSRVISHGFAFPNWKPAEKQGSVYLYLR